MKHCGKCKTKKENECFNKNNSTKDGMQTYCRECMKTMVKNSVDKKPDYYRNKSNEYRKRLYHSKEKFDDRLKKLSIERSKKWVAENQEKRREHINKYSKSKKGWFSNALQGMRQRSSRRGHPEPELNTIQQVKTWAVENNFEDLWSNYINSSNNDLVPSIERINNDFHYTKSNIMLTTWAYNRDTWNDMQKKSGIRNPKKYGIT